MNKIKPRILPRDGADIVVLLFVCLPFQLFPLFGIPFLGVAWLFGSLDAGFLAMLGVYIAFMLFSVWSLQISETGIEFRRLFGTPKTIPWNELSSIRIASRKELIIHGWLWPLFPAREMTACLSSRHHVRFEGKYSTCYFPPNNIDAFWKLVNKYQTSYLHDKVLITDTAKHRAV